MMSAIRSMPGTTHLSPHHLIHLDFYLGSSALVFLKCILSDPWLIEGTAGVTKLLIFLDRFSCPFREAFLDFTAEGPFLVLGLPPLCIPSSIMAHVLGVTAGALPTRAGSYPVVNQSSTQSRLPHE